jgi:hypothetical protein
VAAQQAAATGGFAMMGNKARLGICAATAALAAVAVAGCSGSGSSSSSSGGGAAGSGTAAAGNGDSAAISLVADAMNKADAAGTVKVTGTIVYPGQSTPTTMSGDEEYSPNVEMSMTMQVQGQTLSMILADNVIYMDYPALSAELGGKQWAEIDLSKSTGSLGSLSGLIDSAKDQSPTTQIEALVASGDVTKVGTETVKGQQTTHYSGTLTASQLLSSSAQADHLSASQLASLKSAVQTGGITSETVNLWVSSSGLPVEEKYAVKTANGTVTEDMFMSDWGAPVSVGAPPAAQVVNLTNSINSAGASASASAAAG